MSPGALLVLRRSVTGVLLVFVAVSVVVLVVQEVRGGRAGADLLGNGPRDGVLAVYFHRTARCASCKTMEEVARKVVEEEFAPAAGGRLAWRVVDLDAPGNGPLAGEFQVVAAGVVLIEVRGGRPARWKNLDRAWDLVGDETALAEYYRREIGAFLKGA